MRTLIALILSSSLFAATPVDELLAHLQQFKGGSPVKVRLNHSSSRTEGDGAEASTKVTEVLLTAEASSSGMHLSWDSDQFATDKTGDEGDDTAAEKTEAKSNTPTPTIIKKRSVGVISPTTIAEDLNIAGGFSGRLKGAVVLEDKPDSFEQKPARLLLLKLDPHLSAKNKKYIKQLDAQARIWLDAEGTPLAAETTTLVKGRAFLVITFESNEKESFRFQKVGERLVVTYRSKQGSGSGAGEKSSVLETTKIEIIDANKAATLTDSASLVEKHG